MLNWIINNKEWIFSGIGIAIFSIIISILRKKSDKKEIIVKGDGNIIGGEEVKITCLPPKKKDSNIKIVDIACDFSKNFVADVKLRNIGDQVAFIKEIRFEIYDSYDMINPQITHYSLVKSTATYDIILGQKDKEVFKVSQKILPNDVDRFELKLGSATAEVRMGTIYHLSLLIVYDEDEKIEKSEKFILIIPSIVGWAACYVSMVNKNIAKKNYIKLKKFNEYDGKKSENFINVFESYEKNKADFDSLN